MIESPDARLSARLSGGCHCRAVRFELRAPAPFVAQSCNCSICARTGFLHLLVPARDFQLLHGTGFLSSYRFNTGIAEHLFCRICGVKSYYVPRSNPDGFSVNVHCLDDIAAIHFSIEPFDGRNWERDGPALAGLTR